MAAIVPAGSLILTSAEVRILYQVARIWEVRPRYRVANPQVFELLSKLSYVATTDAPPAATGTSQRQPAASDDREWWTTEQLARATGLAPRTIRLACQTNDVAEAINEAGRWRIPSASAQAFITARTS